LGILQRYLWREMASSFLAVTGVLLAILLVYQGGAVLARAAELQYPSTVVLRCSRSARCRTPPCCCRSGCCCQ
jgi:lipopolysaccharide export LptBFGC system permease protein LptF